MNDDLIEELRGNRNEVIQNGTCAYMSPRPYGLWVPWHLVEKTIEVLEHSKSGDGLRLIDRDIVSRAAEDANRAFGQWMPDAWLRLFENAYDEWARSEAPKPNSTEEA